MIPLPSLILIGLVVLVLLPSRTSLATRFTLTLLLSVPQLYLLPVADFYLSLAFVTTYSLWPEALRVWRGTLRSPVMLTAFSILVVQAVSLLWSTDLRLGVRTLVYATPFFLITSAAATLARENPRVLPAVLGALCAELLLLVMLVIAFRVNPEMEMTYLRSNLAGWFANPNTIQALLDGSGRNNIFDPLKSGGVFVNANVAAAYLGIGAFTAYMLAGQSPARLKWMTGILLLTGAFLTGSKAGVILGLALPLVAAAIAVQTQFEHRSRHTLLVLALLVGPACMLIAWKVGTVGAWDEHPSATAILAEVTSTTGVRLQIWNYAAETFSEAPLLGQGFGGWEEGFAPYAQSHGLSVAFPPHNTLIYLWSQSGVLAALLGLAFMSLVGRLAWSRIHSDDAPTRHLGLLLGVTSAWYFGHGMGENWGLWGEPHLVPLFGTLLGWAMGIQEKEATARPSGTDASTTCHAN